MMESGCIDKTILDQMKQPLRGPLPMRQDCWGAHAPQASGILMHPHCRLAPISGPDWDPSPLPIPASRQETPLRAATQPCSLAAGCLAPRISHSCGAFPCPWSLSMG